MQHGGWEQLGRCDDVNLVRRQEQKLEWNWLDLVHECWCLDLEWMRHCLCECSCWNQRDTRVQTAGKAPHLTVGQKRAAAELAVPVAELGEPAAEHVAVLVAEHVAVLVAELVVLVAELVVLVAEQVVVTNVECVLEPWSPVHWGLDAEGCGTVNFASRYTAPCSPPTAEIRPIWSPIGTTSTYNG